MVSCNSPGRATNHRISYSSSLNTSAREKLNKYKVAAEERSATFCPLVVTVKGIAHLSFQSFLRHVAARRSVKWQKLLSIITSWVRFRVQTVMIKAVDLWIRGSRKKRRSLGFEDLEGFSTLFGK
mmetsp:Transcript_34170/g.59033  ORF Transcript_34170/g.59033 Transcript_34170/m.59033 type:complete len:125 (-) Transcript_34170:56-430(-)